MRVIYNDRERKVASLHARGMTYREIAALLPREDRKGGFGVSVQRVNQMLHVYRRKQAREKVAARRHLTMLMKGLLR